MSAVDVLAIERITNAAIGIMVKRASNLDPGESFTSFNIVTAVVADPQGNTAHYLANLVVAGIEHYELFRSIA